MKANNLDFGRFISNGLKLDYDDVANVAKITQNISVQMVDRMDDAVIEAIEKAAKEAGITDLFIINKKSVLNALKKQIPKKPRPEKEDERLYCPVCGDIIAFTKITADFYRDNNMFLYCPNCGQALDWEVEE